MKLNQNLLKIETGNGFSTLNKKVADYRKNNPEKTLISLGIGDVSKPIIKPILEAMHQEIDKMGNIETFKGYGSYYGSLELREKILSEEYSEFGFTTDEIYISNGTKTDSASILELFDINSKIYVSNPGYNVYDNGAVCLNRVTIAEDLTEKTDFIPVVPKEKYDLIYLCSPNNPIGNAYNYEELSSWVKYALDNKAIILFDNVYYPFIRSKDIPLSIYEIEDARKVAIEFRSFSKSASFTGMRCSYYIIPEAIEAGINQIWRNRTLNRFNGVDPIVQKGALLSFNAEAKKLLTKNIDEYLDNAKYLREIFERAEFKVWGGTDSPFMWVKIRDNISSWDFFDLMLEKLNVIIVPGIIFGNAGDGYFRVSALGNKEDTLEFERRFSQFYEKKHS